jgi:uncharacterized Zn ribbon protein
MTEPFCGIRRKNLVPLCDAHPEIAEEWLYEKNGGWGPEHVSRASGVRSWWECRFCLRPYKAQICNRTSGQQSACPYCASKRVCDENSFAVLFPEVAKEWHPTKNKKLKATDFTYASGKRAWWLCTTCAHSWNCAIADRTVSSLLRGAHGICTSAPKSIRDTTKNPQRKFRAVSVVRQTKQ